MFKRSFSTRVNAGANFIGSVWGAVMGLIFVPVYLRYIGIESYGLIGLFNSVIAFIVLLDFGLSPTINRELAQLSGDGGREQEMKDLKRTLERLNWASAAFIATIFILMSPLISRYWIQPKNLELASVTRALVIMSFNIAIQFTINFYIGGLMGLQKQVLLNSINIICATVRFVGSFLVLALFSPTIEAFLIWQGISLLLQAILMSATLKLSLPESSDKPRFRKDLLRRVGRFAAGVTGITIVSLVLTQTDKIILSKMLLLEDFGYYTLAVSIASMAISVIINSIAHAAFPRFSRFAADGDDAGLSTFYHHCCQIASVLLFPIIVTLALFSHEILILWTRDQTIADNTYVLLSIVAVGTGLNSLMWLPYFLQLAHGWTKLTFYINLIAIFILVPALIWGALHYGAIGGATAWLVLNAGYMIVNPFLMHRRILKGEALRWYSRDVFIPFFGVMVVGFAGKLLMGSITTRPAMLLTLGLIFSIALVTGSLLTQATRQYVSTFRTSLPF